MFSYRGHHALAQTGLSIDKSTMNDDLKTNAERQNLYLFSSAILYGSWVLKCNF